MTPGPRNELPQLRAGSLTARPEEIAEGRRPKLVFFRGVSTSLPVYLRLHLQQQVDCLARWFDVVVVEGSADFAEMCERVEPDLALLESGVYTPGLVLHNTHAHPDVPRLGFLHADAYCVSRSVAIANFEKWAVRDIFTTSVSMGAYTPELAGRLFVWPNFVDASVYRDYAEPKNIPVLLTGSRASHYPWRIAVDRVLSDLVDTLSTPHRGWSDPTATAGMVHGKDYARLINGAMMVPSCGSIAHELVRKHLEVPASRSCLIAEPSTALSAAGFVDMENCLLSDAATVADKVRHLIDRPAELERITSNGFSLVNDRHTSVQRDQIRQWFDLSLARDPGQRIVQAGPFASLTLTDGHPPAENVHLAAEGRDRVLLGRAAIESGLGRLHAAERLYQQAANYHFAAEPLIGVAQCRLRLGNARGAAEALTEVVSHSVRWLGGEPDPVEWAYLVRAELCNGRVRRARDLARMFPAMRHNELLRIRMIVSSLTGDAISVQQNGPDRASLHPLPVMDDADWVVELGSMLNACGRHRLAHVVSTRCIPLRPHNSSTIGRGTDKATPLEPLSRVLLRRGRSLAGRIRPAAWTTDRHQALRQLARTEESVCVLLVSSHLRGPAISALLAGLSQSPHAPALLWATSRGSGVRHLTYPLGGRGNGRVRKSAVIPEGRERELGTLPDMAVLLGRCPDLDVDDQTDFLRKALLGSNVVYLQDPGSPAGRGVTQLLGDYRVSHPAGRTGETTAVLRQFARPLSTSGQRAQLPTPARGDASAC